MKQLNGDSATDELPKKPYQTPQLEVYGDFAALTLMKDKSANRDGGTSPSRHNFTGGVG